MKVLIIARAALTAVIAIGLFTARANAQPDHPRPNEVNARLAHQHARIRQGIHSGSLTHRETAHLRAADARIHRQTHRDRMLHSGHLTATEYRHLNHELNHTSRAIYRKKHNDRLK